MQHKTKAHKQINRQKQHCKQLVYIYREPRQRHSPLSPFIRLLNMRYKRQYRASNGDSERIRSVLCEHTLRVKRIIVVRRSML